MLEYWCIFVSQVSFFVLALFISDRLSSRSIPPRPMGVMSLSYRLHYIKTCVTNGRLSYKYPITHELATTSGIQFNYKISIPIEICTIPPVYTTSTWLQNTVIQSSMNTSVVLSLLYCVTLIK